MFGLGSSIYSALYQVTNKLRSIFNVNPLTLSDTVQGQAAEPISVTGRTMTQYNGVLVPLTAAEPHVQRGRRVENLLPLASDFTGWRNGSGATHTANAVTMIASIRSRIYKGIPAISGDIVIQFKFPPSEAGKVVRLSIWATGIDGLSTGRSPDTTIPASGFIQYRMNGLVAMSIYGITNSSAGLAQTIQLDSSGYVDVTGMPASYVPEYVPRDTAIGADIAIDGGFANPAEWGVGTGWSLSGGDAVATASTGLLMPTNYSTSVVGKKYRILVTVKNFIAAGANQILSLRNTSGNDLVSPVGYINGNGVFSQDFTATVTGQKPYIGGAAVSFTVDKIEMFELSTGIKVFDTTSGNSVLNNVVTEAAGLPLHPSKLVDGDTWYESKRNRDTSLNNQAVSVGFQMEVNGQWLECVKAGTLGASIPLASDMPTLNSPELFADGGFDSATGWTLSNGFGIAGGVLKRTPGLSIAQAYLTNSAVVGKNHMATFDVTRFVNAGSLRLRLGSTGLNDVDPHIVGVGTYSVYDSVPAITSGFGMVEYGAVGDFDIDNVSVREVLLDGTAAFVSKGIYNRAFGDLSEGAGTNMVLHSNDFATSWNPSAVNISGSTLTATGAGAALYQGISATGSTHVYSCYVKPINTTWVAMSNAGYFVYFDIVNGVVGTVQDGTAYIIDEGDRMLIVWKPATISYNSAIRLRLAAGDNSTATTTESADFYDAQVEPWEYATSRIRTTSAPATRTEGLGAYKWALLNSAILTSGTFTLVLGWIPSFANTVVLADLAMLTFDNSLYNVLWQRSNGGAFASYDGSSQVNTYPLTWSPQDSIILVVEANSTASAINDTPANTKQLIYRNLSKGESIILATHAYSGAFTATTFLQFLKAAGGNNSAMRNLRQYDTCIPHADITANFT